MAAMKIVSRVLIIINADLGTTPRIRAIPEKSSKKGSTMAVKLIIQPGKR
jgi:hypothetical protein